MWGVTKYCKSFYRGKQLWGVTKYRIVRAFTGVSVVEAGAALCCFSSDTAVSVPEASKETTFPHISTF